MKHFSILLTVGIEDGNVHVDSMSAMCEPEDSADATEALQILADRFKVHVDAKPDNGRAFRSFFTDGTKAEAPDTSTAGDASTFALGSLAYIRASGEGGTIVARGEYIAGENQYLLRYQANDGRAVEQWWGESALR